MGASNIARAVTVSAVIAAGAFGCGASGSSVDSVGPTRLQIDTQGGHFEGPFPAQLNSYLSSVPTYQLSFEAGDGQRTWVAVLHLSRDQALAGHASIPISAGVLSEGQGSVQLLGGTFVEAASGSVDFSLSAGRASGSVTVAPTALSGSFDGEFSVSCSVPPSDLPPSATAAGGTAPTAGSEVLIVDQGFTTP